MYDEILNIYNNTSSMGIATKLKNNQKYRKCLEDYKAQIGNPELSNFQELIFLYINQMEKPSCKCGNKVKFNGINHGYSEVCPSGTCPYNIEKRKKGGVGLSNKEAKKRQQKTVKEKYGIDNIGQLTSHKERMTKQNPMYNEEYRQNMHNTMSNRYGTWNFSKSHWTEKTRKILNDPVLLKEKYIQSSIADLACELNADSSTILRYLGIHGIREPKEIIPEIQLNHFLCELGIHDIVSNTKSIITPYELDIYLPEYNTAIEHCGLYYHSEFFGRGSEYHKKKYDLCQEKGIYLFQIFEDEWLHNRFECEKRIKNFLKPQDSIQRNFSIIEQLIKFSENNTNCIVTDNRWPDEEYFLTSDKNYLKEIMPIAWSFSNVYKNDRSMTISDKTSKTYRIWDAGYKVFKKTDD